MERLLIFITHKIVKVNVVWSNDMSYICDYTNGKAIEEVT